MAVSPRSAAPAAEPNSERSQDLTIDPSGSVRAGRAMMTFVPGDERSLLVAYLKLVRWLRHQKSTPAIVLRRAEIELLADHLGAAPDDILERLATLDGSDHLPAPGARSNIRHRCRSHLPGCRRQRRDRGGGGTSSPAWVGPTGDAAPATTIVDASTELHDALPLIVITSPPPDDEVADGGAADVVSAPNLAQPASTPPPEASADPAVAPASVSVPPTTAADDAAVGSTTAPPPVEVAVAEPPVPTPPDEVAVGEPPVPTPPDEVAVGEPPVPTPPGG